MPETHITRPDESEIDTILAEDIVFTGNLSFEDPLMIKGSFSGDIKAAGDLFIGKKAQVEARIEAKVVSIQGRVKGNIYATRRVELAASASVDGDITAPDIIMESGCRFNGICTMKVPDEVQKP
ncbi:MAG: polymer-forming cytoskeletal protein [Spirochaetales bacterium]|nr:polymer-forming cytoskeletal protein [Spirochaetales bacterium]